MPYANIPANRISEHDAYLRLLLSYRHLALNLVGADLRARFRRSYLGVVWAVLQPLGFALIVAAVWGAVFNQNDYIVFAIYVFSGVIVWECFATVVALSQESLIGAEGYLRQGRIPLLIFQMRTPLGAMTFLLLGICGLLILLIAAGKAPPVGFHFLLPPLFFLLFFLFCAPIAIIFSIAGAYFRDLKHISLLAIQALFFLSPVMLDRAILDRPGVDVLNYVNPMISILDLFRAPLLYGEAWQAADIVTVGGWIAGLWIVAIIISQRTGRNIIFAL